MASPASTVTLTSKTADAGSIIPAPVPQGAEAEAEAVGSLALPFLPTPVPRAFTRLLLHLLNLLHGATALGPVLVPEQVHAEVSRLVELLLLLLLGLLQLTFRTDALRMVHVVGFHDLETHECGKSTGCYGPARVALALAAPFQVLCSGQLCPGPLPMTRSEIPQPFTLHRLSEDWKS